MLAVAQHCLPFDVRVINQCLIGEGKFVANVKNTHFQDGAKLHVDRG